MGKAAHGGSGTLYNRGCRCAPCLVAHRLRTRIARKARFAERVWRVADGVPYLYAVRASVHGSKSTYTNWGCRCPPCTQAQADATANYWLRRGGRGRKD